MIDFDITQELNPYLSEGEKLIWAGKPQTGIKFKNTDAIFIPFSLLWGGFAFFWESTVLFTDAPFFFKLWGIPFVLVGIYLIIGRFFVDAYKRANTLYGLTQDRVIIKSGIFSKEVKSLLIKAIQDISFTQKNDNSGTITFGQPYQIMQGRNVPVSPQMEFIEEVKVVYDKIIALQRQ